MQKFPTIPDRIKLPHAPPEWIRDDCRYFITVCCAERGVNSLAKPEVWDAIVRTTGIYHERRRWIPVVMLAMPDHLHAIVAIPDELSLRRAVFDFKRAIARFGGVDWQRDFFDHRLRNADSAQEKFEYVLNNPVRAGLVSKSEDWPYRHIATMS